MLKSELFHRGWMFALTDSLEIPDKETVWREVRLPHDWSVDYTLSEDAVSCGSGGYVRTGIGWYRKTWRMERGDAPHVSLLFDGVYMHATVFLNGTPACEHIYGYTPFTVDLSEIPQGQEIEVLVRVDNSHQPGSRWYSGSGIIRPVWLQTAGENRFSQDGLFVWTRKDNEGAAICIRSSVLRRCKGKIRYTLLSPTGGTVRTVISQLDENKDDQDLKLEMQDPCLWDVDSPQLYTIQADLLDETGNVQDTLTTRFGIRDVRIDNTQGLILNGRKTILRGVCVHHDGGCVGAAASPLIWRRRFEILREMGVNAIRFSHNPPMKELLDLCDEMGLLVMDEAFDEWRIMKSKAFGSNTHASRGYSEWFDRCWQEDLDSMVQRDRNHPSIILWSIGNEVPEQSVEGGESVARMLLERVKALDPTRPVTQACDQVKAEPRPATEAFLKTLDIVGVNYADRWRERTETFFDEEKLEHPEWVLMGTEDVSVGGVRGDVRLRTETSVWGRTPYFANMLKAEKLWKYIRVHPFVMGSFMWTGVDYLGECFWPDKHASCGVLDTCGFRKDGFYFYQSQWRPDLTVLHPVPSHLNLPYAPGEIFPLVVYTNCFTVEAFVDGRSYGVKAYEFPAQGMTKQWAHFERPLSPITTSDLHLTWDVPYPRESIVLVGRDRDGRVIREETLRRAGKPERLDVHSTVGQERDGSEICQIEIRLLDREGLVVPDDDREVCVTVEGGELLGMDNGRPDDHTPYGKPARETFRGLALCVVRAEGTKLRVRFECQGLPEACYAWEKVRRVHCAPAWNERNGEDVICAP